VNDLISLRVNTAAYNLFSPLQPVDLLLLEHDSTVDLSGCLLPHSVLENKFLCLLYFLVVYDEQKWVKTRQYLLESPLKSFHIIQEF